MKDQPSLELPSLLAGLISSSWYIVCCCMMVLLPPDGEKITSLVYTNEQTIQAYLVQLQQMITSQLTVISILINDRTNKHKASHSCLDALAQ